MPALKNLKGQKIGRWTVLEKAPSKNKTVYWVCQCDCGNIKEVRSSSLISGKSQSCGCLQKEIAANILSKTSKLNKKKLIGQKFGNLLVIKESNRRAANGSIYWICKCDCGNIKEVSSSNLTFNKTTHCGCKNIISKGEEKIKLLLTQMNLPFEQQKTFPSCKFPETNNLARFDFFVNNKYIIEFDGIQHLVISDNKGWNNKEKVLLTQLHDNIKNNWCKENNIPIIRIPYYHYENLSSEDLLLETSSFLI